MANIEPDLNDNFSDSDDDDNVDESNLSTAEQVSVPIRIFSMKVKNSRATYLTGIPGSGELSSKKVLEGIKRDFISKNGTGCSIKEEKKGNKFLPLGWYLLLQGEYAVKLKSFLENEKNYPSVDIVS